MSTRVYPLPAPPSDVLSSFGLAYDVGKVFERCGLPRPTAADLGALREVLLGFVYDAEPETGDELLEGLEKARAEEDRIAGELAVVRVELVPAPLAAWELELLARADAVEALNRELARTPLAPLIGLSRPDEDQPLAARGHVQVDKHGIPALGAASFARLFGEARTEPDVGEDDSPAGRYSDEQLDGAACQACNCEFGENERTVPTGFVIDGCQLFAHVDCAAETNPPVTTTGEAP